jgi:hypothetical protein
VVLVFLVGVLGVLVGVLGADLLGVIFEDEVKVFCRRSFAGVRGLLPPGFVGAIAMVCQCYE